jgi:hypothetical protein
MGSSQNPLVFSASFHDVMAILGIFQQANATSSQMFFHDCMGIMIIIPFPG